MLLYILLKTDKTFKKSVSSDDQPLSPYSLQGFDRSDSAPAVISSPPLLQHKSTSTENESLESIVVANAKPSSLQNSTNNVDDSEFEYRSSYKFLGLEKMTELEKKTLKGRLTNEYKRITASYSELNQQVIQSLKGRSVTPKELSTVLMNLSAFRVQKAEKAKPLLADNLDSIRAAENIEDVFYTLRPYGSFFDCHIIKHVVKSDLCTDKDRKQLKKYEGELHNYCQRSVFECPHIENQDSKFQSFVMKVDDAVLKSSEMKAIDRL